MAYFNRGNYYNYRNNRRYNYQNNRNYYRRQNNEYPNQYNNYNRKQNNRKRKFEQEYRFEFKNKRVCVDECKPLSKIEISALQNRISDVIELPDSPKPSPAKFINNKINISDPKITPLKNDITTRKSDVAVTSTPLNVPKIDKKMFLKVWLESGECTDEETNNSDILNNISTVVNVDDNTLCSSNLLNDVPIENDKIIITKSNDIAIIPDTYVFIYNLHILENILNLKLENKSCDEETTLKPIIYLPWVVMGQLDEIKDFGDNVQLKAASQKANQFIFKALHSRNPRFYGQTIAEEEEVVNLIRPKNEGSDIIIGTVKQATKKYKRVILLTNDANLKYKSELRGIKCFSPEEIVKVIKSIVWED